MMTMIIIMMLARIFENNALIGVMKRLHAIFDTVAIN